MNSCFVESLYPDPFKTNACLMSKHRQHFKTHLQNDKNIIYDNLFSALLTTSDFNLAKVYAIFRTCLVTQADRRGQHNKIT